MKNIKYIYGLSFLVFLFIILSVNVVSGRLNQLNSDIISMIQSAENDKLTLILIIITNIGEWYVYVPIAALLLIFPESRIKAGIPLSVSIMFSAISNAVMKNVFRIDRPDFHRLISVSGFGFPSGHAMNGTVFTGIAVYVILKYYGKVRFKIITVVLSIFYLLVIGFSRIYLGVHTPADVAGGYIAGSIICMGIIFIYETYGLKKLL